VEVTEPATDDTHAAAISVFTTPTQGLETIRSPLVLFLVEGDVLNCEAANAIWAPAHTLRLVGLRGMDLEPSADFVAAAAIG